MPLKHGCQEATAMVASKSAFLSCDWQLGVCGLNMVLEAIALLVGQFWTRFPEFQPRAFAFSPSSNSVSPQFPVLNPYCLIYIEWLLFPVLILA